MARTLIGPAVLCLAILNGSAAVLASSRAGENEVLAKAGRLTRLSDLDVNATQCQSNRTIEDWLATLAVGVASIRWSGGACLLVRQENPLDAGGKGARCARATLELRHPVKGSDQPRIEIYFERGPAGRLKAYAFRGLIQLPDGDDYSRFTSDFEAAWRSRFPNPQGAAVCTAD